MQPLKAYRGPSHPLFIETVVVGVVLFQQQYQSLYLAMGFGLRVSGVNLGVGGHGNADQLVSPDCHSTHLKGVVVFCKSIILYCLNALMVMSPHGLVAVADPFKLSLSLEAALADPTGSSYPLLVLLLGSSYGLVCLCLST